jgi:alpha-galactosidase
VVGLRGSKGPAGDLGGTGCNDIEYQSNMTLWCIMASPLIATNDVRNMNGETKRILLNDEAIAIDQDRLGKQGVLKIKNDVWNVLVKPLSNGDYAVGILNLSNAPQTASIKFDDLGLHGKYEITDLWQHKNLGKATSWKGNVLSHETKLFRLKKI